VVNEAQQGENGAGEHLVPKETSGRTDHSRRSTNYTSIFSAECEVEKQNFDIDILLIYEFKRRTLNERFLWNTLKQVEKKNKILQEKSYFMIMGREKDIMVSDNIINT